MDGYVQIGTKLDTKDFDAEIKYVEHKLEEINTVLKDETIDYEFRIKNEAEASRLAKQLDKLKEKQEALNKTDLSKVQKSIENIGNSTGKTIKKLGKWALGIFAIESAYGFVRKTISTISQYNDGIAKDIEYINFALASMLQPVIEGLIQLVYKLLTYVNYIAKAWFGVDLFANASAKAMEKGSKSAEKMKKSLAGFDEMNVIGDTSSGGDGGGAVVPSMDLSAPEDVPIPSWIKWVGENGNALKKIILGIGIAIASLKLANLLKTLGLFGKLPLWKLVGGIGLIISGVGIAIKGVIDFIKDPSWNAFLTILQGIALVVAGIAVLMGGWIVSLVALGVAIVTYVIKNWDKVKEILGVVGQWIYNNIITPVINFFKAMFDTILSVIKLWLSYISAIFETIVNIIANPFIVAKDTIIGIFNEIKTFFYGFVQVIKSLFNGDIAGVLNGFKTMFKGVMDSLWTIAKAPLNLIIGGLNALIKGINKISFDVPDWVPGIGGKKFGFNIPQIPKLAVGGIVNMPGRGVPVGGAIAGEAGREGVIPLTDSQAMETLGATIGKYININLTNITKLDNRQIAKEQKKINAQNDFAFNR